MKKIIVSFFTAMALFSFNSFASLVQPGNPVDEESGFRVNGGLKSGMWQSGSGFGLSNLGLGIGFAHNVGYDFEWGLSLSGDYASHNDRIFTTNTNTTGFRLDAEIMGRYMPEVAEDFHFGAHLAVNWGQQFGEGARSYNEEVSFGDLGLRAGLGVSYHFSDYVAGYFLPGYSLNHIRFGAKTEEIRKRTLISGIEFPVGLWFNVSDDTGIFLEANTRFTDFSNFTSSFREDLTLGVSFSI